MLGAGKTYAVVIIYNKSFDNNFNAPAWQMVNTTAEDANPAPGWSIGNTIHTSAAGSTSWRPSSHDYFKAYAIRVNGTGGGGEPVWSATMTAGETNVGHGYDANGTPVIGALDDDNFEYKSFLYRVRAIDVGFIFRFVVEPGQLGADETLTLEFGGHEFAFSDRLSEISVGQSLFWRVPAALNDLGFPVGSTATVCLRTDMQVCPLGSITRSELRVVDDVSAEEGEDLTFTVELSPASTATVTVDWATSEGTATSGTDFPAGSGTLTFAPGVTEQTFTVATTEDMTVENHETLTVTLSNAANAVISGVAATGTIENDDWPPLAWSTTLTVGNDFLAAEYYGYYASVGSLTDEDFEYVSTTFVVEQVTVSTGREVFFHLDRSGLPTEDIMTLEIDGHEFSFADRKSESTDKTWVWDAPADLHDPATNFPVGSTATVCLRSEGQACPTDGNAAPAFSSSATFDAAENQTAAGMVLAADSDADDDITGYAITGGADEALFEIGATDGALAFKTAPNFEDAKDLESVDPANAAGNNQYVVVVTATSGAGDRVMTATQTITVTVTDVGGEAPGQPAAPAVSAASATSLSVSWTAPANAGPAITDYDYRHRTSPDGSWTEVTDTAITALSATITGLADGTSYDVQVRATNDEGTGDWSDSGSGATDANPAGVRVSATALTVTEQDAAGDSYTVVLDTEPTHDVTVTVGGHAGTDVSLSSSTLTFTPSNWDRAQTVTVTALNDDDTADDAVTLTHAATSTDGNYSGIAIAGVAVTVTDNDTTTPTVTLALSAGSIGEDGGVSTVTATVSPASAAAFTVTVAAAAVAPAVAADFRLSANPVLSFAENATASTGSVTITGVDNDVDAADKTVTVSGTVSAASVTAPANRTLTLEDDDAAGATVSATALTVTEQDAAGDSYTVVLDTEPTHDVTVTVGGHAGTDVSLSSSTLTFTPSNWDRAQTVTVTALNDDDTADDAVTLTHAATSTDGNYSGIAIAGVAVTVTDNDTTTPTVTLALSAGSIGEDGGVSTVTATVSPASAAAFTVTVAAAAVAPAVAAENATDSTGWPPMDAADKTVPPEHQPCPELRRERDREHRDGDDHGGGQRCGRGRQDRDGLGHRVGGQRDRAGEPDADPRGRRRGGRDGVGDGADRDRTGHDRGQLHGGPRHRADARGHGDGRRARGHGCEPERVRPDLHNLELGPGPDGDGDGAQR